MSALELSSEMPNKKSEETQIENLAPEQTPDVLKNQQFTVVVPAAGVGKRMLAACPKQYLTINNNTILNHTITRLLSHPQITKVVVAISEDDDYFEQSSLATHPDVIRVSGGKERVDSVLNGLHHVKDSDWVLVHDAARPCITHQDIDQLIAQCIANNCGGILAAPVVDTMKLAVNVKEHQSSLDSLEHTNDLNTVSVDKTIDRSLLWHAFTPQMFKIKELTTAIENAQSLQLSITDEASAIESLGLPCLLVSGRRDNIKITRPEDLMLASFYLQQQSQSAQVQDKGKICE